MCLGDVANAETNRAMAIAAGRRAMQTGSSALMEQADPHQSFNESMLESVYAEFVGPDSQEGNIAIPDDDSETDEIDSDVEDIGLVPGLADDRFNPSFVDLRQRAELEVRRMRGQRTLSASGSNVSFPIGLQAAQRKDGLFGDQATAESPNTGPLEEI